MARRVGLWIAIVTVCTMGGGVAAVALTPIGEDCMAAGIRAITGFFGSAAGFLVGLAAAAAAHAPDS